MKIKTALKDLLKAAFFSAQRMWRRHQVAREKRHIQREELIRGLAGLGVQPGDAIFLHSSLKSLGFVEGGPRTVFDAFREIIGRDGTLVVPTYYQPGGTIYAACQQPDYIFDPRIHGTGLGALPAAFLAMPGVERSLHPTHSVSALGRHARFITEGHHLAPSIFGPGSPWERFLQLNGKVLGLGVSMGPVTFYHLLEDLTGDAFPVPVRMAPRQLRCRDKQKNILELSVHPLDPSFMPRRIDHPSRRDLRDYFWREFDRAGLLTSGKVAEALSWFIPAMPFLAHLRELMRQGITIYSTPAELAARPLD
jgi:aminoglycoside N3'-acetyltransferase